MHTVYQERERERERELKQSTGSKRLQHCWTFQQINSLEQTISVVLTGPSLKGVRILNVSDNETKFDTCMSLQVELKLS